MTREVLLMALPPFNDQLELVKKRQTVEDIMRQIPRDHARFSSDYDLIAVRFIGRDKVGTLENLFDFLKANIAYDAEGEKAQILKNPTAILETGVCDCKCYALFIGGVLGALNRLGYGIQWNYAFAQYMGDSLPGHVFIQAEVNGKEYWVDPVLDRFDQRDPEPTNIRKKQIADMALYTMTGVPKTALQYLPVNMARVAGDPATAGPGAGTGSAPLIQWVKDNPLLAVGGAVALVWLLRRKKR